MNIIYDFFFAVEEKKIRIETENSHRQHIRYNKIDYEHQPRH